MQITRLSMAALLAVMALSVMAANASAFHPLFLTASGKSLLFTGLGVDPILRAESAGVPVTFLCEKALAHGFVLNNSTLSHLLKIILHSKCVQKINGGADESCSEPIETKPVLAELGLLTSTNGKVVLLLAPSDGTTNFLSPTCGGHVTKIGGTVVAEIPATNVKLENQIEVARESFETVLATLKKNNQQSITEIFLLGSQMTKQELTAEGFIGGKTAIEAVQTVTPNGPVTICTKC